MKKASKTDWKRLSEIDDSAIDTSDIAALDESFFQQAELRTPSNKQPVTLRLDADVLTWFKEGGQGYQTRINQLLRRYMESHQSHR
jgi:uncharacterized protein (DUF4415 family)